MADPGRATNIAANNIVRIRMPRMMARGDP